MINLDELRGKPDRRFEQTMVAMGVCPKCKTPGHIDISFKTYAVCNACGWNNLLSSREVITM
jgi:hypothetical protein